MLDQGRLHPRLVVVVPSDCYHWILQPNISRFTWRKWRNFPLESCKGKKKVKMLVMGPICSIRAACCPWSAQKSPFLTSQIDSTVWKTLHMFPGIAYDNLMVFRYRLTSHIPSYFLISTIKLGFMITKQTFLIISKNNCLVREGLLILSY